MHAIRAVQDIFKDTKHPANPEKYFLDDEGNELCDEILVCNQGNKLRIGRLALTIDVVKGQSADKTRNRNRRRKSMSSRFRMGPEIVWLVKGRGLSAVADRSQPKNRQPESRMTMIP